MKMSKMKNNREKMLTILIKGFILEKKKSKLKMSGCPRKFKIKVRICILQKVEMLKNSPDKAAVFIKRKILWHLIC